MNITIRQLIESASALQKLGSIEAGNGLSLKQVYAISKIVRKAEAEIKEVETLRNSLVARYGEATQDEHGQAIQRVKSEYLDEFIKQVEEIYDANIEIPGDLIQISDLTDSIPLNAADLYRLSWLIVGD